MQKTIFSYDGRDTELQSSSERPVIACSHLHSIYLFLHFYAYIWQILTSDLHKEYMVPPGLRTQDPGPFCM